MGTKEETKEVAAGKVSPYMKELKMFVRRASADFIAPFDFKKIVADRSEGLIRTTVDTFVLQASLVRPLKAVGRPRLAFDASQLLEPVLAPLVALVGASRTPEAVAESAVQIEALRSVLGAASLADVANLPCLAEGRLRPSTALHFMFGKAPPELKSPHDSAGWSISRYTQWLEDHPHESDRLQLIRGALESYVARTRIQKEKSYVEESPVMLKILQRH